ncbi:MAG: hypothetical protein HY362_04860 [Candidatus Aenigmarchaeota archaeon]|nr:hypothetical protein [Candidatus Aenigmarchaeota archaeon]
MKTTVANQLGGARAYAKRGAVSHAGSADIGDLEQALGYRTGIAFPGGLDSGSVFYREQKNTRVTTPELNERIARLWKDAEDQAKAKVKPGERPRIFDADRIRYEGANFDPEYGTLTISWSRDKYSNHFGLKEMKDPKTGEYLPLPFHVNPLSINGIVVTEDGKIPLVQRNPNKTDQGRIWHIVPQGFIDIKTVGGIRDITVESLKKKGVIPDGIDETTVKTLLRELKVPDAYYIESVSDASARELSEELRVTTAPMPNVLAKDNLVLGLIRNTRRNFDTTIPTLMKVGCSHADIGLNGDEATKIEWVDIDQGALTGKVVELSKDLDRASGHLRGDLGLLVYHLYGEAAYRDTLTEAARARIPE